jgi:hypothetical protein
MPPNVQDLPKSESTSLNYKQIGNTKDILKYIFVRRIQLAVLLRDIVLGHADVSPIQVAASKALLATLKDMEATARQDALDGIYNTGSDDSNNNFTEGLI